MSSWHMHPNLAIGDVRDSFARYTIFNGEMSLTDSFGKPLTNLRNLVACQFSTTVLFAMWVSALLVHIIHIVLSCTKKQMIRITTRRIIAFVKNEHPVWDWAIVDYPGHSRCGLCFALPSSRTIASIPFACLPFPAIIGAALVNLCPKTIDVIFSFLMTNKITSWLTFHIPALHISDFGKACFLTATTHAQSAWIGGWHVKMNSSMMAAQESKVLPLLCASSVIALISNVGRFIAPTLAFSVGRKQSEFSYPFRVIFEIGGKVGLALGRARGMIFHVISSSEASSRSQDAPTSLAISIPFYSCILAQVSEYGNP